MPFLAVACSPQQGQPGSQPVANAPVSVVTAAAAVQPMGVEIEAVGTTEANQSVQITSKASNVVTALRFDEGAHVRQGDVLVEMDDAQAKAELAEAEAALADSRSQYNRSRDLAARQAVSMADLDRVEATLKADEARVAAAKAKLADTVVRAAFGGRTGFRQVSVGSFVSPGTPITTLDDTSIIKLDFTVPETYLYVLKRGLPVTASSTGLPDRTFKGTVTTIESRIDPVTRSIKVRAEIANPDGVLLPGMFMTVELQGDVVPTLLVPEEAIVPEQGQAYVFVVHDHVVERRRVRTGKRRPGQVEIVDGLEENERVVVEGSQNVRDGTVVQEIGNNVS
ncbi:MAG TPA: efflux RND transporter periplasmic adaptor subunit [Gammaproteobacteria bacterium]|nr:efflux RND transporter periplasmic adaptor subunit [Gammaproteobacteria bacterium]